MKISEFRPFLITMALCVPGGLIRFAHPELSPFIIVILTGFAIFGASFMLTWTCEAAEMDIPQAVAVAVVALIAVLPEYSVDMYFTWMAGQNPDSRYTHYAIANMTGANRLLIGLGWSVLVFIFAVHFHRGIDLLNDKRTDLAFLGLATLYALFVSWKGSLTLLDGCIFFAMYVGYMAIVSRRPVEAGEQEGPSLALARLPRKIRISLVAFFFVYSAVVIAACAEPFSEGLVASGKLLGIDEFLLVQWLAPVASEAPEFIVGIMFALRGNAALALGSLLSSKLNQWTLLVGMIPACYALSSGSTVPMAMDTHQFVEIFLTAAQSLFALVLLLNLHLGIMEAVVLFLLFCGQFLSPVYEPAFEALLALPHDPLRLHRFFAYTYFALGVICLIPQWRDLLRLRKGFFVRVDAD